MRKMPLLMNLVLLRNETMYSYIQGYSLEQRLSTRTNALLMISGELSVELSRAASCSTTPASSREDSTVSTQ